MNKDYRYTWLHPDFPRTMSVLFYYFWVNFNYLSYMKGGGIKHDNFNCLKCLKFTWSPVSRKFFLKPLVLTYCFHVGIVFHLAALSIALTYCSFTATKKTWHVQILSCWEYYCFFQKLCTKNTCCIRQVVTSRKRCTRKPIQTSPPARRKKPSSLAMRTNGHTLWIHSGFVALKRKKEKNNEWQKNDDKFYCSCTS